MNGTNENKVDSLIAELRSFGDRPPPRFAWNLIADELESAVKKEREDWEELQEITLKLLEHERADANRRVEDIASAAKHEREVLREAATEKMLEGATIIDYRGNGNAAAIRDALKYVLQFDASEDAAMDDGLTDAERIMEYADHIEECQKKSISALAKPPRNCDVGTAEEQVERFKEYCQSNMQYYRDMFGTHDGAGGWDCREDCPIGKMIDKNDSLCDHCELLWAQIPYEEGGLK